MKVVLLSDIKNLGKCGDIKNVADGFARNFLFPKGVAELATEITVKRAEEKKQKQILETQKNLEETQMLAKSIEGKEIIIKAKSEDGKLFGSINEKNIAGELKKDGVSIKEGLIILSDPIKETGEFEAKVELGHGIEALLKIVVEEE